MNSTQAWELADLLMALASACAYHDADSKYEARSDIVEKLLEIFPEEGV